MSSNSTAATDAAPISRAEGTAKQPAATAFQRIAGISELEPHGQLSRWVADHDVLVYRLGGKLKALSNICPHFGGPVGYHRMKEGVFTCLWHNYQFAADDGRCLTNSHLCLREYKVKEEDGGIWVQLVEET